MHLEVCDVSSKNKVVAYTTSCLAKDNGLRGCAMNPKP